MHKGDISYSKEQPDNISNSIWCLLLSMCQVPVWHLKTFMSFAPYSNSREGALITPSLELRELKFMNS
jgi:hypothetical protein